MTLNFDPGSRVSAWYQFPTITLGTVMIRGQT